MQRWRKRIRGAIGMGVLWGAAWSASGVLVALGFVVATGSRPDPPVPLLLGVFGFLAGVLFSGVLTLAERRRRFEQMSVSRFAAWGAMGGFTLASAFVGAVALNGDPAFLGNLLVVGPAFALAAAGSAAGSLSLAKRATNPVHLAPPLEASSARLSDPDASRE